VNYANSNSNADELVLVGWLQSLPVML